jgi:hypothetical protein
VELEAALGVPVEFRLPRRADVTMALRHGYARLKSAGLREITLPQTRHGLVEYRPIGELLIDMGVISYPDLIKAVSEAARSGKRLGEYLLAEGLLRQEQVEEALARQQVGEFQSGELTALARPATQDALNPALAECVSTDV